MLNAVRRRLDLRREALAELSTEEMAGVDAGRAAATIPAVCFVYDPTELRCVTRATCATC